MFFKRMGVLKNHSKQVILETDVAQQVEELKIFYKEEIETYKKEILFLNEENKVAKEVYTYYKERIEWAFDMIRELLTELSRLKEKNAKLKKR